MRVPRNGGTLYLVRSIGLVAGLATGVIGAWLLGACGQSGGEQGTGGQDAGPGQGGGDAGGTQGGDSGTSGTTPGDATSPGDAAAPPTKDSGSPGTGDSAAPPTGDAAAPAGCVANCTGKTCGDDGCGGTCGGCPPSQLCNSSNACQAPTSTATVVVDAKSQRSAISPGIYGVALNNDDSTQVATLNRWGGDSTGSYNWMNDIFNTGTDWNCANYQGLFTSPTPSSTLKTSSDQFVSYNASKHLDTLMTIPITGWLGNVQTQSTSLASCGGGTMDKTCCGKIGASESVLVDKGSATLDTSYMQNWVQHLASTFGTAANGGIKYYQLDNEPDNWQGLRTDIFPSLYPPGMFCEGYYSTISQVGTSINQDFINRTIAYATAVKNADSTADVLFMCTESPTDLVSLNGVECGGTGSPYTVNSSLTSAILTLGAQHEAATKQRILDCVDMHYPSNGSGLDANQPLWDSSSSSVFPHIQGWINAGYPGTGICVSEYNWNSDGTDGSTPDPTTATLEADALGFYGRLGVRLAAYWTTLVYKTTHLPVYNAMAMYRNYDGKGGHFGSYSVGASSQNAGVHAFASSDVSGSPTKLWLMLVNVSGADQSNLSIAIQNFSPGASAQVYRMTNGGPPTADTAGAAITGGMVSGFSLPSGSAALLVIP